MGQRRGWMANVSAAVVVAVSLLANVPGATSEPLHVDGIAQGHEDDTHGHAADEFSHDGPDGSLYRLYRAYFLRDPDAGGFTYWFSRIRAGYPLAAVSDDFARSTEFVRTYGALDHRQFVDRVYRNVLERRPDAGGYAYWLGQMAIGMKRGHVMIAFSDSREFRAKTATPVPVPLPDDPTAFAILTRDQTGQPVRWNPCRPVRVAANFAGSPAGTEPILQAAIQRLAAATGVGWTYVGRTAERAVDPLASNLNRTVRPDNEVIVSWPPTWDSPAAGMGGASWRSSGTTGETWFVAGSVQISSKISLTNTQMLHLLLHELGHVAGLAHPAQSSQVMSQGVHLQLGDYRAGDRTGLTILGRGTTRC